MEVRIVRSRRRRRTVEARLSGGVVEIRAPGRLSRVALDPIVEKLTARLLRRAAGPSEGALRSAFDRLNRRYFDGALSVASLRWSKALRRWGSCNPRTGAIRIARSLSGMPVWIRDYILLHEMAHLRVARHDAAFRRLVDRYPQAERARGFLAGFLFRSERSAAPPPED